MKCRRVRTEWENIVFHSAITKSLDRVNAYLCVYNYIHDRKFKTELKYTYETSSSKKYKKQIPIIATHSTTYLQLSIITGEV
jgi:hypothetical protein